MKRWYEGLGIGDHAAHIYRSDAEQVRVVMDTISWMNEDQRLVLLSDRWDTETRAPRPRVLDAAIEDGHMLVLPARSTLCPSGRFDAKAIEGLVRAEVESAADDGRSDPVIMWDLDWLAADDPTFEAHVVQQSSMSLSPSTDQVTMIGQYGTSFYSPKQLERIQRVNPLVLEGGLLTRKFWVVTKSSMGRSSKGGHTLRVSASAERAKIDEL